MPQNNKNYKSAAELILELIGKGASKRFRFLGLGGVLLAVLGIAFCIADNNERARHERAVREKFEFDSMLNTRAAERKNSAAAPVSNYSSTPTSPLQSQSRTLSYSLITSQPAIDQIGERFVLIGSLGNDPRNIGGKRASVKIVAQNTGSMSFDERAKTVMKAASDIQKALNLDAISVTLHPSLSMVGKLNVAQALYAPDGKGFSGNDSGKVWEVRAFTDPFTEDMLGREQLWEQHRPQFLKNGRLDEAALISFLVKKYKLSHKKGEPFLLMPSMKEYPVR